MGRVYPETNFEDSPEIWNPIAVIDWVDEYLENRMILAQYFVKNLTII